MADGGKKAIATVSDKQKAEREAERIAGLEKERQKRMQSDSEDSDNEHDGGVMDHISADQEVDFFSDEAAEDGDEDDEMDAEDEDAEVEGEMLDEDEVDAEEEKDESDDEGIEEDDEEAEGDKDKIVMDGHSAYRLNLRLYNSLAKQLAVDQLPPVMEALRKLQAQDRHVAAKVTRSLLIYKRNHYRLAGKVVSRPPPTFDLIAFFALVAELYPTSDHFHPVCSPTFTFAVDVLRLSQINSLKSCGIVILLSKMLMKWVQESQR